MTAPAIASTKKAPSSTDICAYCRGAIDIIDSKNRRRCVSCGRDPDATIVTPRTVEIARVKSSGVKCSIEGCPGLVDPVTGCACCAARDAFLRQHMPKRYCDICSGDITDTRSLKYCQACKPVANRVSIANAPSTKTQRVEELSESAAS